MCLKFVNARQFACVSANVSSNKSYLGQKSADVSACIIVAIVFKLAENTHVKITHVNTSFVSTSSV